MFVSISTVYMFSYHSNLLKYSFHEKKCQNPQSLAWDQHFSNSPLWWMGNFSPTCNGLHCEKNVCFLLTSRHQCLDFKMQEKPQQHPPLRHFLSGWKPPFPCYPGIFLTPYNFFAHNHFILRGTGKPSQQWQAVPELYKKVPKAKNLEVVCC